MAVSVRSAGRLFIRRKQSDFSAVRQVWRDEEYKIGNPAIRDRVARRYEAILGEGRTPVIVDAGANIGAASRWFSVLYPQAVVVAVEPDPENLEILRRNADGWRVEVVPSAIGSEAGFVRLIGLDLGWSTQTERADDGLSIVTVAECVASVPKGKLFIAKIDIEGFEEDLFSGNTDWVADAEVVFIEPHDWMLPDRHTSRHFQTVMARHPFQLFLRGENLIYVRAH